MKEIFNIRYYILFVLFMVTIVLVLGEVSDDVDNWMGTFIVGKSVGFLCGYIGYKLTMFWDARGKIPYISNELNDDEA